jgi:Tfp pilus tip-associated adhesin PilY1
MRDDSDVLVDGWWKLGEVFHSVPREVGGPAGNGLGPWAATASYREFVEDWGGRPRAFIVGANDGMLHAFKTAVWNASLNSGRGAYVEDPGAEPSIGEELWAFVSPELVPKLKGVCDPASSGCPVAGHTFMVDGSIMVRDIWIGNGADKSVESNSDQWRSIVIYGHRDGGSTYVALDITDIENPVFLWQFPAADDTATQDIMGKSWLDVFPAPASIGAVRWDHDDDSGTAVRDRWVALLSAGYDPKDERGRGIFMVDAYTGQILWKAVKTNTGPTAEMDYSFPATPVFYTELGSSEPYMAGIVAADHGGQLWHIPTPAQAMTDDFFTYTPTRFFTAVLDEDRVVTDNDGTLEPTEYQRRPFFFAPSLTLKDGKVRAIIGSGDRDLIIPHATTHATINGYICDDQQRLYAINVEACPGASANTSRPCTEEDLQEVVLGTSLADRGDRGWFYKLTAGEKAATPFAILNGLAYYSVFAPTAACGDDSNICSADAKGEARLYARHYITGDTIDFNADETLDTYLATGEGIPVAPAPTLGVSSSGISTTLIAGSSDSGIFGQSSGSDSTPTTAEIMRFTVTRELHDVLH